MSKNFKQLKGKFGRVLGYPYDPRQDPGRAEPSGSENYTTGSFFIEQVATGSFGAGNSIYASFYCAGGREGVDTYWRMYTVEDSGSITGFDSRSLIYPKVRGAASSIEDYDEIGPGGYWESFGIGAGYGKKYFSAPLTEDVQGVVLQISGSIGRDISSDDDPTPKTELFFDDFVITEESRKVEVTPDGILIYSNPDSYVKLDSSGLTIKAEDLQVNSLEAGDIAAMGNLDSKGESNVTGGAIAGASGTSGTSGTSGSSGTTGGVGQTGGQGQTGNVGNTGGVNADV